MVFNILKKQAAVLAIVHKLTSHNTKVLGPAIILPTMATTKPPSIDGRCQQDLAAHFESRTFETPVLKLFDVGDKSLLSSLFRAADHQPFIPVNPAKPKSRPCLLLYDLENAKHKDNLVYKYIDCCKRKQPSALYATSGAGKTRSIFEYHKDNLVYKYIDCCKKKQPSALYATSGAGKTRSIFEYLSQNYGLYFVAHLEGETTEQVGSADLMRLLTIFEMYGTPTACTL
jgi:hypothetical protein